jgi:hypothetical protein
MSLKLAAKGIGAGLMATQSEESEGALLGLLAKGANPKAANAAREVFEEHLRISPSIFTNVDDLVQSGAMQGDAARQHNRNQGWFIGADGKPRYEISDQNASVDSNFTMPIAQQLTDRLTESGRQSVGVPLRDFLKHDSLFNAYPDIADSQMYLWKPGSDMLGDTPAAYSAPIDGHPTGNVHLNLGHILKTQGKDRSETVRSVMHEVQHAIQNKEGFARGAGSHTALDDVEDYLTSPLKHGAFVNERLVEEKLPNFEKLLAMGNDGTEAGRDFADEMAYYMSAGEAEARSVEKRLRMPARLRASDDGHPYGDMNLPSYMLPEGSSGPTLFQMIEMMTRGNH